MCRKNIFNVSSPVLGSLSKRPTPRRQIVQQEVFVHLFSISMPNKLVADGEDWRFSLSTLKDARAQTSAPPRGYRWILISRLFLKREDDKLCSSLVPAENYSHVWRLRSSVVWHLPSCVAFCTFHHDMALWPYSRAAIAGLAQNKPEWAPETGQYHLLAICQQPANPASRSFSWPVQR